MRGSSSISSSKILDSMGTPHPRSDINHGQYPTLEEKARKPWKYEGYPAFSSWMASSNDFFILRRFGSLNARVLLMIQDEIIRKEDELKRIDLKSRSGSDELGDCSSFRFEPLPEREAILKELRVILKEYNEYIASYAEIKSRPSAQSHQIENVEAWFHNHPLAVAVEEQEFVRTGIDVIALVSQPKSPLRRLVEKCQPLVTSTAFRVKHREGQVSSETTLYHSSKALDAFVTFMIIALGLLLLLGPMWSLQFIQDDVRRLGLITGAVLLFTAILASTTIAKPFEVLAATAAYTAVLMVFLQSGGTNVST